jgi:hypothetical protein
MAVSVASRGTEEAITWWQGVAQHLCSEVEALRCERDGLVAQVTELAAQLEAAKAELIKLTLILRHESERQPRPGDGEAAAGDGLSSIA